MTSINKEELKELKNINIKISELNRRKYRLESKIQTFLKEKYKDKLNECVTNFRKSYNEEDLIEGSYLNYHIFVNDYKYDDLLIDDNNRSFYKYILFMSSDKNTIERPELHLADNDIILFPEKNIMIILEADSMYVSDENYDELNLDVIVLYNLDKDFINRIKMEMNI